MIMYDGVVLERDFKCRIFRQDTDSAPKRQYEEIDIPGRNGKLLIDNGKYDNVLMSYTAVFYKDCPSEYCRGLINFLLSEVGYQRLEDGEHPDEFYMAKVDSDFEPMLTMDRGMAKVTFSFSRKPQRYLKIGENRISVSSSNTVIENPTRFNALPLIRIFGTTGTEGLFYLNDMSVKINSIVEGMYINCDTQEAYRGVGTIYSMNGVVELSNNAFPYFKAGENSVSFSGGIRSLYITPRWWRL